MKKLSKIIALMLVMVIAISAFSLSGYAVATPLEAGSSKETAVNIPEFGVEYVSELSVSTEYDWFKFTTNSDDAFYSISFKLYSLASGTGGSFAPWVFLYDENLQTIESNYNSRLFNHKLEKNTTYYIMVRNGSFHDCTGTYEIKVSYKLDETGSSQATAKTIGINETVNSSLDGYNDVDYFTFTAPISGKYNFSLVNCNIGGNGTSANFALNLNLHDEYGKGLGSDYCNGEYGTAQFSADLEAGEKYYLKVFHKISTSLGNYEIKVTCDSLTVLTSIAVTSVPLKTTYIIGDTLDTTGLKIKAEYSDGTSKTITTGFTVNCAAFTKKGTYAVTVSYTEDGVTKTCTFNVSVKDAVKTLDSISVTSMPDKTTYEIDEALDTTGLAVKAYYSDGTSKTVTNYTLGTFDSSTAGTKTILVSYTENGVTETATFTVEVEEAEEPASDVGFFESLLMKIMAFFIMIIDAITSIFNML